MKAARGQPPSGLTRRRFIAAAAQSTATAALLGTLAPACSTTRHGQRRRPPKVALLATVVYKWSHAQHFIDRLLEGYGWQGRHHWPELELAALYVDQFPEKDLARERARRFGVKIYPTIEEALTLGGPSLAVDGVLIIGEHGRYPKNAMGQTLYPRYAWFKKVVRVFEASGRAVPVFNDKHLSTEWPECREMVDDARRLDFPFMAGSSLPVTWRIPALDVPRGAPLAESVCVCYGGVDSYDFHGLETAQCMSERRAGGEAGVRSLQAWQGAAVWDGLAARPDTQRLALAALARSHTCGGPSGYTYAMPDLAWLRKTRPTPIGYFIEHRDGFRTTMLLLNGVVSDFTYAGLRRDNGEILSCQMYLPMPPNPTLANFFSPLMNHIEAMILTGQTPYPVERTLLTSGLTLFGVRSLAQGGAKIETPELNVEYGARAGSTFWRA
jgi:hypothetical protein